MISRIAKWVRLWALSTFATALFSSSAVAQDKLKVVVTIPDLADLVQEVGGERVAVTTICRGKENLHAVTPRPSHLVALSKADLFVQIGLSLETSFVPGLIEQCGNAKVKPGGAGFVNGSEGWSAIDVPRDLSRQGGDLHPQGNPHMNLDPRAGRHLVERIYAGLCRVDAASKPLYTERRDAYLTRLAVAEERWSKLGASWKGKPVVVYHQEYSYLIARYELAPCGAIESKPGIPPTPNHIAELVGRMKAANCATILTAIWSNGDQVERVAEATGARTVELPNMCGGIAGSETWIGMMDLVHRRLDEAIGMSAPQK
ncbi:MAG: zinc ABC transporter substrate-binding protein [Planctomycetes bacterium]|nr:zinc ABC transporter substrate-binding protein [Planctomycetota bacterium]